MTAATIPADQDAEPRRNALILSVAGAVTGSSPIIAFSLGGLAGLYLLGEDKSLATLPISFFVVGGALGAIPAAMLMNRIGRRAGFIVGAAFGILGGLVSGLAVLAGSFAILVAGSPQDQFTDATRLVGPAGRIDDPLRDSNFAAVGYKRV